MKLLIIPQDGEILKLEANPQETVLDVKRKIEKSLGVPVDRQSLSIFNLEFVDELDIEFLHCGDNQTGVMDLYIKPTPVTPLQISVKILTKQIFIEVNKWDTVHILKVKIHKAEGIPVEQMTIFFSGIEMKDECLLSDYELSSFSEICVVFKSMPSLGKVKSRRLNFIVESFGTLEPISIPLQMHKTHTVREVKELLLDSSFLPRDDYIFIYKQEVMKEDQTLEWHDIGNGDVLEVTTGSVIKF